MAIKIVLSDKFKLKVQGTYKNESGLDAPFDFTLTCKRMSADDIKTTLESSEQSMVDFIAGVATDWSGVKGADDQALPYSEDNYKALCNIPGVALLAFRTYLEEVGAKAKN
jgi:hypothetical protein